MRKLLPHFSDEILLLLALLLLCIPVIQPLLSAQMTCGYDNIFHLWRAVEIEHLWEQGVLHSRWAPDMGLGFGFPLFSFAAPGASTVAALLHQLGFSWALTLNMVFISGVLLGAVFMFFLARDLFGNVAGIVAAAAFIYAPFQAYDLFNRGSLSESLAWAFPPLVLWALQRWCVDRDRRFLLVGELAFAALIFCHYPFAFLFAPLLALWVLLTGYLARDWRVVGRGVFFGVLGLGLTAFFWLSPLTERAWVQTGRLLGTWVFDYHHNFLPLSHLLALPRSADPQLINDWPQKAIGALSMLLALLPLLSWRRFSREQRWQLALLLFLTLLSAVLMLPLSLWLWEHVPMLSYIQFPWRNLGPAAFCVALLIGAGAQALFSGEKLARWRWGGAALVIVTVILANLGWFYPQHCALPDDVSPAAIIAWERATDTLGTTAKGEYLPIWVERMPELSLDAQYAAGGPIVRLPEDSLPAGSQILRADYGALRAEIDLELSAPTQVRYLAFYYPGWQVKLDGARIAVGPEPETGFVSFALPAGRHSVVVNFGETPTRLLADACSVLSVLVFGVVFALQKRPLTEPVAERAAPELAGTRSRAWWVLVVAVGLVLAKLLLFDTMPLLWRRSRLQADGSLARVALPLDVNFGGRARLLGVDGFSETLVAGETSEMTFYWQALQPEGGDWHMALTFVDVDDVRWESLTRAARWGRTPPPLYEWPQDGYARMDRLVDLPPGMPPGSYRAVLSFFDRSTLEPASVLGADGNPLAPELFLADVQVLPPAQPASLAALEVPPDAPLRICKELQLRDAIADRAHAAPGDLLAMRWVWEALATPDVDYVIDLVLRDAAGAPVRTWLRPPVVYTWPTSSWQAGERWVGRPMLRLPRSLESGAYTLDVVLPACDTTLASLPLQFTVPERVWDVPTDVMPVDVRFGDEIALAGYTLDVQEQPAGTELLVRLAWQALAEMDVAYRMFVHVLDAEGHMLAQSDGDPVAWTRPTTGWVPGEVVLDERVLSLGPDVASGTYEIRVGWYVLGGARLATGSGADTFTLKPLD